MIWDCTSRYCPEQYDIYRMTGPAVAYFRIRHGNLYVHPYKHGEIDWDTIIYEKFYSDERGWFDNRREFRKIKNLIDFKIYCYLIKQWFKSLRK